ncbi:MAG: hypothetical protein JWO54_666 [Candidatus Saccharibacteria bacterium]|nr:hypothetical protein [Candidatus Saccharibacteria bacterium]MDB5180903.1 hypothetical protein [Candidatus Saccharibacteria bacterium]
MIAHMYSGHKVKLSTESTFVGFLVLNDDGLFDCSEDYQVYMESPQAGTRPWIAYVRKDLDEIPDFKGAIRVLHDKYRVLSVSY